MSEIQKKKITKKITPTVYKLLEGQSTLIIHGKLSDELEMDKELFEEIWDLHPEEYGQVKIMGKLINTPRWQVSYGKDYYYSGVLHKALPIEHPYFKKLLDWVCGDSGENYQQMLINWYQNENHYIGPHSDDEKQLVNNSNIYSFSFGQSRQFVITSKKDKSFKKIVPLNNNTLVVMCGEMQKHYKHSVPKEKYKLGQRINITFRLFK